MNYKLSSQKSSTLLMTLMFMIALMTIAVVFVDKVIYSHKVVNSQTRSQKAMYLAEAGINKAIWFLKNTAPNNTINASWRTSAYPAASNTAPDDACDSTGATTDPCQEALEDDANLGTYTMWVEDSEDNIKITSKGTYKGVSKTVRVFVSSPGSPVGWWKFEETTPANGSAGAIDSSGNSNTGTWQGPPTATTGQVGNKALTFDGSDDYVSISVTSFNALGAMTISVWVKPGDVNTDYLRVLQKADASGATKGFILAQSGTNGKYVGCYQSNYTTTEYCSRTSSALANGTWYHLAMAYDGSTTVKMYVNGADVSETNSAPDVGWAAVGNNFNIGRRSGEALKYYNGIIDDVRIYNSALTAGQIRTIYSGDLKIIPGSWQEL